MMRRYLHDALTADLGKKILLLSGPRQCGKTTLSRDLEPDHQYLSQDLAEHRLILDGKLWDREKSLLILDELHKRDRWKAWLKGVYDVEGMPPAIIVTGSARMSAFGKTGDSLAGRHFAFRLHPIDLAEALEHTDLAPNEAMSRLLRVGGFPEPFLDGSERFYRRWRRSHIDLILREDLVTLTAVRDIQSIETLIELLRRQVGSTVSAASLARDLGKSPTTVQGWLKLLEDLFVVFRVTPWHRNVARALLKEPKFYFHDNGLVLGDDGARLENLIACALLKAAHVARDVDGRDVAVHYIRDKEKREVDFAVVEDGEQRRLIEVKLADPVPSPHLARFADAGAGRTQVVGKLDAARSLPDGTRIEPAVAFLSTLTL